MSQLTTGRPDVTDDAVAQVETLMALRRYEQALSSIARALILAPTDSRLHCQRALARQRLGHFREASRAAGEAVAADPEDPRAYQAKASALAAQARTRRRLWRRQLGLQAREAARRAVQLAPEDALCHCTASEAELLAGDWTAARAAAQQALELAPGRVEPYVAVAQVALAARDFGTARASARRALALDPANYDATNHLGSALVGLGRWGRAATAFAAAARLDPEAEPARRNLARLGKRLIGSAVIGIAVLLLVAPHGLLLLSGATCGAAGVVFASRGVRSSLGSLGLHAALCLARLPRGAGLAGAGAVVILAAAVLTALVGATVAAAGPWLAGGPVAAGAVMWSVDAALRRSGGPRADSGLLWPRSPRAPAGASVPLVVLAAGLGWVLSGLISFPSIFGGRAASPWPGNDWIAPFAGMVALCLTSVAACLLWPAVHGEAG